MRRGFLGGRRLEILERPGHAPASICLIDRENRNTHIEGSDFEDYSRSAARLAGEIEIAINPHNVPTVDGSTMITLGLAFEQIRAGTVEYAVTDDNREYQFNGFSVIVKGE